MPFLIKGERNEKVYGTKTYVCDFVGGTCKDLGLEITTAPRKNLSYETSGRRPRPTQGCGAGKDTLLEQR
jgi:hypothetical protein